MNITRFENIYFLYLLLAIIPMVAYYFFKLKDGRASIQISSIRPFINAPRTAKYYLRHLPFVLRVLGFAFFVLAMAKPQLATSEDTVSTEGVDIVIALDISGSMLARDFTPDRISAAKDVATKFIIDRRTDRLGLVVFAGESFTQSPLTTDHATLINLLNQVDNNAIEDGTAIGNGLATAVARLKESSSKSKVVILLTDGVNNAGQIAPITAAEIAETYGIKVYTIGVGTTGTAPYPAMDPWGNITFAQAKVEIDEVILKQIAEKTGGQYFRATSNDKLQAIYDQINALEKTKIEVQNFVSYRELFPLFLMIGILFILIEIIIKYLYLRQIP